MRAAASQEQEGGKPVPPRVERQPAVPTDAGPGFKDQVRDDPPPASGQESGRPSRPVGGEDVQGLVPARLPQSLAQSGNVCSTTRGNGTLVVPNAVLVEGESSTTERSFLWATPVDETGRRKRVRVYIGAGLFAVIGLAVGLAVALIENWTSIESALFNQNNFTGSTPAGICTAFFFSLG